MRRKRNSKAKNQTLHFIRRSYERIGVLVDRKLIQKWILNQKFDENFYLLNKQSNRVTRYRYKFQDKWYIIPYDKNTHKVITIFEDREQDVILETTPCVKQQFFYKFIGFIGKLLKLNKYV